MGDREFVPMALRPETMHRVRAVQDREIASQGQAAIGRTADFGHAKFPIRRIIHEDHLIFVAIERPAESCVWSGSGQMFDQREQRPFPVIEGDVINIVEYAGVGQTAKLRVGIPAAKGDGDLGSLALDRMGNTKRAIEVPGKGNSQTDERRIEALEMLPQGFEHELIRQRRRDGYRVDDGLK